jgi:hypothetical protein
MTEDDLDLSLAAALRVTSLSEEAKQRLRTAVEREWREAVSADRVTGEREPRSAIALRLGWLAAAAAVLVAVGVGTWIARPSARAAPAFGAVSRTEEGALSVASAHGPQRNLTQGAELRTGDRMRARGPALIALARGGTLRVSSGSALSIVSPGRIVLDRGLIYLDIPSGSGTATPLDVDTTAGTVEHVGTEFEVMSNEQNVRVRVREGRIRFVGKTDTIVADAGTELVAAPGKRIVQRRIDTYGLDWSWMTALAPDYAIEGRSLMGFLRWVSRELGRPLNFADANARQIADRTILHGSVQHQAPIEAMANVLATTSLTYEIRGDAIWVLSGSSASL